MFAGICRYDFFFIRVACPFTVTPIFDASVFAMLMN
jgi:hypothetical protein